jgi:hypothetical protein
MGLPQACAICLPLLMFSSRSIHKCRSRVASPQIPRSVYSSARPGISLEPCKRSYRSKGTRSHRSAAEHWRFALPPLRDHETERHDVAIASNAVRSNVPDDIRLRYLNLADDDIADGVLSPVATVAFCVRDLSLREAPSVGDPRSRAAGQHSAQGELDRPIRSRPSAASHRHRVRRVRAHGTLDAMTRDCVRHTCLAAAGWRTLRFTWGQVMHRPNWVLEQVRDTIACTDQGPTELVSPR